MFIRLRSELLNPVELNPDGTIPEPVKRTVDYIAVAHSIRSTKDEQELFLAILSPADKARYQVYLLNAHALKKRVGIY